DGRRTAAPRADRGRLPERARPHGRRVLPGVREGVARVGAGPLPQVEAPGVGDGVRGDVPEARASLIRRALLVLALAAGTSDALAAPAEDDGAVAPADAWL